jgi:hypothetical protein
MRFGLHISRYTIVLRSSPTFSIFLTLFQAHPNAATWRTKPFPLYDDILGLVEGRYATGDKALHMPEMYASDSEDEQLPADENRPGDELLVCSN